MTSLPESKLILPRRGWIVQLIPFVVALIAFILSASALSSCRFLLVEQGSSSPSVIGLFRTGSGSVCSTIRHAQALIDRANSNSDTTRLSLDVELQVAEAGGLLGCLLGFTSLCLIFSAFFSKRMVAYHVWRIVIPIITILAAVTQLMTFALFGVTDCTVERGSTAVITCSFDEGANYSFAASILYLALGIGIIFFPRRSSPLCSFADGMSGDVETADGMMDDASAMKSSKKHDDYNDGARPPPPPRSTRPANKSSGRDETYGDSRGPPPPRARPPKISGEGPSSARQRGPAKPEQGYEVDYDYDSA